MPVDHTHKWTICVKGVDGADITHFIKKVQFKLHADTYSNPTRSTFAPAPRRAPALTTCAASSTRTPAVRGNRIRLGRV